MITTAIISIVIAVTGHPVNVQCDSPAASESGSYVAATDTIHLAPWVCRAAIKGPEARLFGYSVIVIAHEAAHASGLWNESEAECSARSYLPKIFNSLGMKKPLYRKVAAQALSFHKQLPANYRELC